MFWLLLTAREGNVFTPVCLFTDRWWGGGPPWTETPLWRETPTGQRPPKMETPLGQWPPLRNMGSDRKRHHTQPWKEHGTRQNATSYPLVLTCSGSYCSSQYAYYWNAFLLSIEFNVLKDLIDPAKPITFRISNDFKELFFRPCWHCLDFSNISKNTEPEFRFLNPYKLSSNASWIWFFTLNATNRIRSMSCLNFENKPNPHHFANITNGKKLKVKK